MRKRTNKQTIKRTYHCSKCLNSKFTGDPTPRRSLIPAALQLFAQKALPSTGMEVTNTKALHASTYGKTNHQSAPSVIGGTPRTSAYRCVCIDDHTYMDSQKKVSVTATVYFIIMSSADGHTHGAYDSP